MIKLVAFDWNGTLFDDSESAVEAENIVLRKLNLRPSSLREFQATYTIPIRQYWINRGLDIDYYDHNYKLIQDLFEAALADWANSKISFQNYENFSGGGCG